MQLSHILAILAVAAGVSASPTPWNKGPPQPPPRPSPPVIVANSCPANSQPSCCNSALELLAANCAVIVIGNDNTVEGGDQCTAEQSIACCNYQTGECSGYGNEGN